MTDPAGRGGFTLIEALIVLAILGIVAVLAVDSFRGFAEKYRVEGETKRLYADLTDARARAMQRSRASFVMFTSNGYTTYEDSFPAPDGEGGWTSADTLITNVTTPHTITRSFSDNLVFRRDGTASLTGHVRFPQTTKADYDCVGIGITRLHLGQFNAGACVEK